MAGQPMDTQMTMSRVEKLRDDIRDSAGMFEELGGEVRDIDSLDAEEIEEFIGRAMTLLDELMRLLEKAAGVPGGTNQTKNEIGLRMTVTQSELEREIQWLEELIDRLSVQPTGMAQHQRISGLLITFKLRFLPWLQRQVKRLGSLIWKVVAGLLTPKEWKVSGQAVANIFGLGGNVGVEITFGP